MRIGLLTTSFPRQRDDVPGRFVLGFAEALAARGHELEVLCPEPHELRYERPPQLSQIDVRWLRYLAPRALQRTFYGAGVLDNVRARPLTLLGLPPFALALARAARARRGDWDALVSHWALPCALIAGELRAGRPHLAVLHSADVFVLERLPSAALRRLVASRIGRTATALVFSSRELRRRFLALLAPVPRAEVGSRSHVCPMGIDPRVESGEPRAELRARLGVTGPTLLSLGRLITLKGVEHAIEAVAARPEWELIVVGDGPARRALERAARARAARVRFVGELHGDAKRAWFEAADAFVLPSIRLRSGRSEGMPTSLLEALEHDLPVIASEVGGIPDVIRSGENGFLVPAGDCRPIVVALDALRDPETQARMRQKARETAALYHWSELAPGLEQLLLSGGD